MQHLLGCLLSLAAAAESLTASSVRMPPRQDRVACDRIIYLPTAVGIATTKSSSFHSKVGSCLLGGASAAIDASRAQWHRRRQQKTRLARCQTATGTLWQLIIAQIAVLKQNHSMASSLQASSKAGRPYFLLTTLKSFRQQTQNCLPACSLAAACLGGYTSNNDQVHEMTSLNLERCQVQAI